MDRWILICGKKNGNYYLLEINPRFVGTYLHAYDAGIDFDKLIENNVNGIKNRECFNCYEESVLMMMYDAVVVVPSEKTCK